MFAVGVRGSDVPGRDAACQVRGTATSCEYRYESGHGGRSPGLAFAPGPAKHTIYLAEDFSERWPDLVAGLGKHRASKVCLYLTRLTGVDRTALRTLLERSLAETRSRVR